MTATLDHLAPPADHAPKRDRWGRYLIRPADGGRPVAHTRATTWAGAIDDKEGLIGWSARVAMLGVARRPDLYAIACAAKTDQDLKEYVDAAKAAGGAEHGRNVGTALHSFTEAVDRGEEPTIPAEWRADVDAYRQAIDGAGLTPVPHLIERVCVVPALQVAGTFDRCYTTGDGDLVIGDVKTGQSLDWSALSISVQLALYANAATIYNPATETHEPMPPVRRDVGYVVHVPSGKGVAEVLEVDLVAGWDAAQVCGTIRELRSLGKRKGALMRPVATAAVEPVATPEPTGDPFDGLPSTDGRDPLTAAVDDARTRTTARRAWVLERVDTVKRTGHASELIALWPKGVPGTATDHQHTNEELDLVVAALDIVDGRHGLPLTPDPAHARTPTPLPAPPPPLEAAGPDEGAGLTSDEIEALRGDINAATDGERDLLTSWLQDATAAGAGFSISRQATTRRRAIVWAGLALAALCDGRAAETDLAVAALHLAGVDPAGRPIGAVLGSLTGPQAAQVVDAAHQAPGLALSYIDGQPRLAPKTS